MLGVFVEQQGGQGGWSRGKGRGKGNLEDLEKNGFYNETGREPWVGLEWGRGVIELRL